MRSYPYCYFTIKNKTILITGGLGFIGLHVMAIFDKIFKILTAKPMRDIDDLKDSKSYKNYNLIKADN